jgi:hypothetical protein
VSPKRRERATDRDGRGRTPDDHGSEPKHPKRRRLGRLTIRPEAAHLAGPRMNNNQHEVLLQRQELQFLD